MKLRFYHLLFLNLLIVLSCYELTKAQSLTPPTLTSPADGTTNYKFTKVTYTWDIVASAVSYDLQVCKDIAFNTADLKTYSGIDTTIYTPSSDYLEYNQQYYWRVRVKVGSTFSSYSDPFTFTTGTPGDSIGVDANASIAFDHANGRITRLIFKNGSNQQLLNSILNDKNKTGLGRVNSETGTKLASWTESAGSYVYNYENSLYGSKTLTVTWDASGISVAMTLNLSANKSASLSAAWQPGGDEGPLYDSISYTNTTDTLAKSNLIYPGVESTLYSGSTILAAMDDGRYDEYFGYWSSSSVSTVIKQALAFGPIFSYASSSSPQTINLNFAVKNKANFFSGVGSKYIIVNTPSAGSKLLDQSSPTIKWETFGVSGALDIKLSTDGGSTWSASLVSGSTPDDGSESITLPNLSASVPLNNCIIKITGTGAKGSSGVFSIIKKSSSVFRIPNNLTASPTDQITVPVTITPGVSDKVCAFDIRLQYNKSILTYVSSAADTTLKNWTIDVSNNSTSGYLQIGGFNGTGASITKLDTITMIKFKIIPASRVGMQTPLIINNSYLSAADTNAAPLSVLGIDGSLTLYSRVSGFLRYIINNKPIVGDSLVRFVDVVNSYTIKSIKNTSGFFDFTNEKPGTAIKIIPDSSVGLPPVITNAVTAIDARTAFTGRDGGSATLTPIQKIAADVNNDGVINSTDAYTILSISTGALTYTKLDVTNWIFVDSTFSLSAVNWTAAPKNKTYLPLDTVKSQQSFWGMVRGDVDGSYGNALPASLNKIVSKTNFTEASSAVELSVPFNMSVRRGDTLELPLNVKLKGNTIGAFNSSVQFDKNLLAYCKVFNEGETVPLNKGWYISAYFDPNGKLNIGATDFSDVLDPIAKDGTIAAFKFIVNNDAKLGDTIHVSLTGLSVADSKLTNIPVSGTDGKIVISTVTSANNDNVIYNYSLAQNYPNPFNPSTSIEYSIKKEGKVEIEIFNSIGQRVAEVFNGYQQAGHFKINWNAKNFASGIYFYRIISGEFMQVKKMMLLK